MNGKLVLQLSLLNLGMCAVAVVLAGLTAGFSVPVLWLLTLGFCAFRIERKCAERRLLHGLLLGVANAAWIVAVTWCAMATVDSQLSQKVETAAGFLAGLPGPPPRLVFVSALGVFFGIVPGVLTGLAAVVWHWVGGQQIEERFV